MSVLELDFDNYTKKLNDIQEIVVALLCTNTKLDVTKPVSYAVAQCLEDNGKDVRAFRDFFLAFAHTLLDMQGATLQSNASFRKQCGSRGYRVAPAMADADHIEYLTSTSLALYFLGLPFNQPWDHVLDQVENHVGGLPNGVCVAKAIGDIIRAARIANRRQMRHGTAPPVQDTESENTVAGALPGCSLLIHSHMPLILHASYVTTAEVTGCLPDSAHVLGHCYELLQMRLYAHEGLPFGYFVPLALVKAKLAIEPDFDKAWLEALVWLFEHVIQEPCRDQRLMLIDTAALPPMFLNRSSGLFTSPRLPEGTPAQHLPAPLPASFMRTMRVNLNRDSLLKLRYDHTRDVLAMRDMSVEERIAMGHALFGAARAATDIPTQPVWGNGQDHPIPCEMGAGVAGSAAV